MNPEHHRVRPQNETNKIKKEKDKISPFRAVYSLQNSCFLLYFPFLPPSTPQHMSSRERLFTWKKETFWLRTQISSRSLFRASSSAEALEFGFCVKNICPCAGLPYGVSRNPAGGAGGCARSDVSLALHSPGSPVNGSTKPSVAWWNHSYETLEHILHLPSGFGRDCS